MPCLVKAVVQLARKTGITADTVDNDFYFSMSDFDEIGATRADNLRDTLTRFYNNVHAPGTVSLASHLGDQLDRSSLATIIKFYSLEEPLSFPLVWGSPKQTRSFTLGTATPSTSLPSEIALCMTYHSDLTDVPETATNPTPPPAFIRPASRRRGRIYLGPFNANALVESPTVFEPTPSTELLNGVAGAGGFIQGDLPPNTQWNVVSQADEQTYDVAGGWVDNAWDSQRRRGNEADARTTFSA